MTQYSVYSHKTCFFQEFSSVCVCVCALSPQVQGVWFKGGGVQHSFAKMAKESIKMKNIPFSKHAIGNGRHLELM